MGKNKGARITITLECCCDLPNSEKRKPGIFRYTSSKNRRNTPNRIEVKKFCKNYNKNPNFKESK